jgi:Protein of unknown function (DUF2459)
MFLAGLIVAGVSSAREPTVYVARRGWHIDLGLAVEDLSPPLTSLAAHLPEARYAFFGFADKHYLLAANRNAPVLLSALWPGAGIILATGLSNSPQQAFGETHVVVLHLDDAQLTALQAFIWKSLRTQGQTIEVYQKGPYEGSAYFLTSSKYSAFHTCNTWGAEALKAAGFQVHTHGVIFAGQLWVQARRLRREQDERNQLQHRSLQQCLNISSLESVLAPISSAINAAH